MLRLPVLLALAFLSPQSSQPAPDLPAAKALLVRLAERQKDASTLRSSYVQERRSALLKDPLVSKGKFLWRKAPGCIVFEVAEPREARIRLDATTYQVHRPAEKQAERFEFASNDLGKALLQSMTPQPGELEQAFRVESFTSKDGRAEIVMVPLQDRVKEFLTSFRLIVREDDAALEEIGYRDGQGDDVRIVIKDLEVNPELDAEAFDAELPAGTELLVHKVEKPTRKS